MEKMKHWSPPDNWLKITTIDAHTEGEPFRIITGGFPDVPGDTILARRRYVKENLDHLRKALMWEPRGHADMYGCILSPPVTPDADIGVLFIHNEGYMCSKADRGPHVRASTSEGANSHLLGTLRKEPGRAGSGPRRRLPAPAPRLSPGGRSGCPRPGSR